MNDAKRAMPCDKVEQMKGLTVGPLNGRPRSIAALWGRDIAGATANTDPAQLLEDGFELLALDRPAATHLQSIGLDLIMIEDLIDPDGETLPEVYSRANELAAMLFAESRDALSTSNMFWPEADFVTLESLVLTLLLSLRLGESMRAEGLLKLRLATGHRLDPFSPDQNPQPVVTSILNEILSNVIVPAPIARPGLATRTREALSSSLAGPLLRAARRQADSRRFQAAATSILASSGPGRLVFPMLSHRELDRSGALVKNIAQHFGEDLVVIPWMNSRELIREAGSLTGLPWLPTPPLERGSIATERRFRQGIDSAIRNTPLGELEPVRSEVLAAFQPFAIRWASHASRLEWAIRALDCLRPKIVIASRNDIEYQVPIEAARVVGIPTLTIPHAVVQSVSPDSLRPRPGIIHLSGIANPTAPLDTLRVTDEALITYEYPRRREAVKASALQQSALNVLILSDGFGRTNHPSVDLRSQQRALRMVAAAVREAGDGIAAFVKPHPAMDERAERLLLSEEESEVLRFLPRAADLIEAVGSTELVIAVNCIGSALVHTVTAGVPVVQIQTSPAFHCRQPVPLGTGLGEICAWQAFWGSTLLSLTKKEELTEVMRRLMTGSDTRREMAERSLATAAILRPPGTSQPIVEIIEELLSG